MERELDLPPGRRVWLKDYGWTPVGSFKLLGTLNWMHQNLEAIGERPGAAHSSGNFAAGISITGQQYNKRVLIVMPDAVDEDGPWDETDPMFYEMHDDAIDF